LDMNNNGKIVQLLNPTNNQDAATKSYVDTQLGSSGTQENRPTVQRDDTTNATRYLTFISSSDIPADGSSKRALMRTDADLYYNPHVNTLYAGTFSGSLTGNATSATTAVAAAVAGTAASAENISKSSHSTFTVNGAERMRITSAGRIGIGTTSPTARLHVTGSDSIGSGTHAVWSYQYFFPGQTPSFYAGIGSYNPGTGDWNLNASIFATDYIVSDSGFGIYSDIRIKRDIVDIIDDESLIQLRKLEPKKFTLLSKDIFRNRIENKYGFIAQDVEKVIPYSVLRTKEIIPNFMVYVKLSKYNGTEYINQTERLLDSSNNVTYYILEYASLTHETYDVNYKFNFTGNHDSSGNEYKTITQAVASDSSGNQIFKILLYSKTYKSYEVFTKKIISDKTILIYSDKSLDEDIYIIAGQEVDDFRVLDKDPILTINTAALQEVDRQQQADKARIAELEATVSTQQSLINDILERLKTLEKA